MRSRINAQEFRSMFRLAVPVVTAELAWVMMSIVDTMMVGRLGAEAIGAVSLGSSLFLAVAIFGIGLLLGMDTLVSQAFGAGEELRSREWLIQGTYLALVTSIPLILVLVILHQSLRFWGIDPEVRILAGPYFKTLIWSLVPLLLYTSFRRYLQGVDRVHSIMFVLVSANLVNIFVNWVLIYGNLGAPALGVVGAGWATMASRSYMALALLAMILLYRSPGGNIATVWKQVNFRLQICDLRRLSRLGLPAAIQLILEVGVFATATSLAALLGPTPLAAHQIALSAASFTFMVPLGVSAAGAVRVGQAMGGRRYQAAAESGWTAVLLGCLFMSFSTVVFIAFPERIVRLFTREAEIIETGVMLLLVAAYFQLFDGVQVIATGALRGMGDTRTPMLSNLAGHWLLGLPTGMFLCFVLDLGVVGLWMGLSLGLTAIGITLVLFWRIRIRRAWEYI